MMKNVNKVLVIASGRSALEFSDYNYQENDWVVVTVNNAWKIPIIFDYWCKPKDFAGEFPTNIPTASIITEKNFTPCLDNHGGSIQCTGAGSITLNTLYWVLDSLSPGVIGLLGCDMDYTPSSEGHTAFYGKGYDILGKTRSKGKPDPFYQAARSKNKTKLSVSEFISLLYTRFREECDKNNTQVVNFSKSSTTLLPYQQQDAAIFDQNYSTSK
jgi:hypothetical protein